MFSPIHLKQVNTIAGPRENVQDFDLPIVDVRLIITELMRNANFAVIHISTILQVHNFNPIMMKIQKIIYRLQQTIDYSNESIHHHQSNIITNQSSLESIHFAFVFALSNLLLLYNHFIRGTNQTFSAVSKMEIPTKLATSSSLLRTQRQRISHYLAYLSPIFCYNKISSHIPYLISYYSCKTKLRESQTSFRKM